MDFRQVEGYSLANRRDASASASMVKPQYGSREDYARAIEELKKTFAGDEDAVSTNADDLYSHGFSVNDYHLGTPHTVVLYPTCTEDVVKVVHVATKYRMPIIAYSGGTSLEGHFRGYHSGGICLDMSRMNKIIEIHEADSDLVCQPGVCWSDINDTLRQKGQSLRPLGNPMLKAVYLIEIPLFFPLDPAPTATIGGMLSTGCSGTNAVRYGTGKAEWFLNATVVLPSGEVIKTRRRSRKSSAGFDTTKLFIGAEGTLGIVTEVTIRLTPVLPTAVAVVHFPDVRKATEAVREVTLSGVGIQCVELLDDLCMHALNQYGQSENSWPEKDTLLFKLQGHNKASLVESGRVVEKIVARHGGFGFKYAKDDQEAEDLWETRKNALYACLALVSGSRAWSTDVCVPVSKLPELVYETKKDLASTGLTAPMAGHVGDGNFHAALLVRDEEELNIAREVVSRMVHRAIALDGTCELDRPMHMQKVFLSGEHGVGIGKKEYLVEELGPGTVELMKTVKRAIDPLGLFNPGKLYPDDPAEEKLRK
ncbi:FAD-linked oxidase-like protein [Lentinula boryana]|uniref:D-lactate dehydrogenase (cytochrome) n=1 Tax=Lentinula boryana TaxID=40481 RepID=A0ABQ8QAY8_9AGAR|nr:FAD-linked oxidase-like protein [Lentinula boryana]